MKTNALNYKIINLNNKKNLCYVFFSSNGIINGKRTLKDVLDSDYYEFSNVAKSRSVLKKASKIIFLRDLELNFYVNGINDSINSIDCILDFLLKETKGCEVIAVGYSGGGYIATICGLKMSNVKRVYSFGGVYNLFSWRGSHLETSFSVNRDLVANQTNFEKEKYYNLIKYLSGERFSADFYHFYANKSESDLLVLKELKSHIVSKNFHFIEMDSNKHGGQLSYYDYVGLLNKPINSHLSFKNAEYSNISLSIKLQGFCMYFINKFKNIRYKKGVK